VVVKLNRTAIPIGLLESGLFHHKKIYHANFQMDVKQIPVLDEQGRLVGTLSYLDIAGARIQGKQETDHTNPAER